MAKVEEKEKEERALPLLVIVPLFAVPVIYFMLRKPGEPGEAVGKQVSVEFEAL